MKKISIHSGIAACFLTLFLSSGGLAQQAEEIKGKKIQDQQGRQMGAVEDVVVGPDGEIQSVIVEKGGFMGLGGKTNTIPLNALTMANDGNLIYRQSREQAQASMRQKETGTSSYHQAQLEEQQQAQEGQRQGHPEIDDLTTGQQQEASDRMDADKADELMGRKVLGKDGSELGTVQTKHLSEDGESVEYLIVQGDDNKMHPVPVELVKADEANKQITSEIDDEIFQNSPSFSPEQQPQLNQQQWTRDIQNYYGISPAWQNPGTHSESRPAQQPKQIRREPGEEKIRH